MDRKRGNSNHSRRNTFWRDLSFTGDYCRTAGSRDSMWSAGRWICNTKDHRRYGVGEENNMRCVMCDRSFLQSTDWRFPFCHEHTLTQYEAWRSCSKKPTTLSWPDVVILCEDITRQIRASKREYVGIYGIPRGGIPIADILSDLLRLPIVPFWGVPKLWYKPILVVDDIEDVSFTLQNFLFW